MHTGHAGSPAHLEAKSKPSSTLATVKGRFSAMASAAEVSGGLVLSTWHPLCGVQFYSCILAFPSLPRAEPVPSHAALTWTVQSPVPLWECDTCDPAWASEIGSDETFILDVVFTGVLGIAVGDCFDRGSDVVQAGQNPRDVARDDLEPLSFWPCQEVLPRQAWNTVPNQSEPLEA